MSPALQVLPRRRVFVDRCPGVGDEGATVLDDPWRSSDGWDLVLVFMDILVRFVEKWSDDLWDGSKLGWPHSLVSCAHGSGE